MTRPAVYVCTERGCAERAEDVTRVVEALGTVADVECVGCQDICDGPVVGAPVGDGLEWFARVDGGPQRDALVAAVEDGSGIPEVLQRRWLRKRSGWQPV